MNKSLLLIVLAAVSLVFYSCKDDSNSPGSNENPEIQDTISINLFDYQETVLGGTNSPANDMQTHCLIENLSNRDIDIELEVKVYSINDHHQLNVLLSDTKENGLTKSFVLPNKLSIKKGMTSSFEDFYCELAANTVYGQTIVQFKFYPLNADGERIEEEMKKYICTFQVENEQKPLFKIVDAIRTVSGKAGDDRTTLKTTCQIENLGNEYMTFILSAKAVRVAEHHVLDIYYGGASLLGTPLGGEFSSTISVAPGEKSKSAEFECFLQADVPGNSSFYFEFVPLHSDGTRIDDYAKSYTCRWEIE